MRIRISARPTIAWSIALTTICVAGDAFAQRGQTAELTGTAKDASGAVLPDVIVTASSPQLIGGTRTIPTNVEGRYRFSTLLPGVYEVSAARDGFKTLRHSGVELVAGLELIVDFRLELAPVAEVVKVDAVVPAVDVRSSASPIVIDQEFVQNLPLNRGAVGVGVDWVNLAPGVTNNIAFGGSFRGNPISLDGTSGNDPEYGAPIAAPSVNWIDQIQIISLGANAQYGDYTGARLNAITRSGSNRFSGLAEYWTTRPGWTDSNRGALPSDLARRFRPAEVLERWGGSAQLGGPVVRDRLWFFSGFDYYRDSQRPFGFSDAPRAPDEPAALTREPKVLLKLTAAPAARLRLEGYVSHVNATATNANAGPLVRPEATGVSDNPTRMGNVRLTWTPSDRTLVEARYGTFRSHFTYDPVPPNSRSGPASHYDVFTNVSSANIGQYNDSSRRTNSWNATLTHYVDRFAGANHEFKLGLQYERTSAVSVSGYPGSIKYFDFKGTPFQAYFWDGRIVQPTDWTTTAFGQDTWQVTDRLTIEPGIRAAFYGSSLPLQGFTLYRSRSVAPRLGVAWDLDADHRTVVRAHYGRYYDPMVNSFYWALDSNGCSAPVIVANVIGPGQFEEFTRFGGCRGRIDTDADVKHSYVAEYVVGAERELWPRTSIRVQYVRRSFKDFVGYVDTGPTHWDPVSVIDPGPDGLASSGDDGRALTIYRDARPQDAFALLTNPAGAWRRYSGFQVVGTKRHSDGWEVQASYTWSRTRGNVNNEFGSNAASGDLGDNGNWMNPNRSLFSNGRTSQDYTHDVKVIGTYMLPFWGGARFSGIYRHTSGQPWARGVDFGSATGLCCGFLAVEPIGTRELPAVNSADLRIEKTFTGGRARSIGVYGDVFNVNNQGIAQRVNFQSGPNFGLPVSWSSPRTLRAGLRVMF